LALFLRRQQYYSDFHQQHRCLGQHQPERLLLHSRDHGRSTPDPTRSCRLFLPPGPRRLRCRGHRRQRSTRRTHRIHRLRQTRLHQRRQRKHLRGLKFAWKPFAYTAREWDADTDLYYLRSRYYEPAVGRFVQQIESSTRTYTLTSITIRSRQRIPWD